MRRPVTYFPMSQRSRGALWRNITKKTKQCPFVFLSSNLLYAVSQIYWLSLVKIDDIQHTFSFFITFCTINAAINMPPNSHLVRGLFGRVVQCTHNAHVPLHRSRVQITYAAVVYSCANCAGSLSSPPSAPSHISLDSCQTLPVSL